MEKADPSPSLSQHGWQGTMQSGLLPSLLPGLACQHGFCPQPCSPMCSWLSEAVWVEQGEQRDLPHGPGPPEPSQHSWGRGMWQGLPPLLLDSAGQHGPQPSPHPIPARNPLPAPRKWPAVSDSVGSGGSHHVDPACLDPSQHSWVGLHGRGLYCPPSLLIASH